MQPSEIQRTELPGKSWGLETGSCSLSSLRVSGRELRILISSIQSSFASLLGDAVGDGPHQYNSKEKKKKDNLSDWYSLNDI